jgi:predicted transcriptional regulator of viral defense system
MRFHGLTEQLPKGIMLASARARRPVNFAGTAIRFFRVKEFWGYGRQRYADFDIFVAGKEKCVIDSLLLRNVPFDEIAKAVRDGGFGRDIVEMAVKCGNSSLSKRLGWLMERFGMDTGALSEHTDNNYVLLDWNGPRKGARNRKWKIIENRRLDDI